MNHCAGAPGIMVVVRSEPTFGPTSSSAIEQTFSPEVNVAVAYTKQYYVRPMPNNYKFGDYQ